jgi:ferredoxin-nitrate reductase
MHPDDAARHGIGEGDPVRITSRRGSVRAPARLGGVRQGVVFVPFHYGYWDRTDDVPDRAANEMTVTAWDPVSKQPIFKVAAVRVAREG